MYVFDLSKLLEGDILLINVNPRISQLMHEKAGSAFHHTMLYTGGSSHIHSDKGPGVQADNTARMLFEKPDAAVALRLKDHREKQALLENVVDNGRAGLPCIFAPVMFEYMIRVSFFADDWLLCYLVVHSCCATDGYRTLYT